MAAPLVHKAVEPGNLSVKGKKRYAQLLVALTGPTSDAIIQPKFDGVYAQFIFIAGAGWRAFSRTGQPLVSAGWPILDEFHAYAETRRRYNGELWLPGTAHSTINGLARKQSEQHLEVRLFDSFDPEGADEPYLSRLDYLFDGKLVRPVGSHYVAAIQGADDLYEAARALRDRGASAYDGLILRDANGLYVPGAGKDGETIKIKPRAEGDFRVVGTTRGIGNRAGGIGALVVDLGGRTSEVGTGLTDADVHEGESPIGRIARVEYLSLTKDGKLREPSFKGYRFDKDVADVLPEDTSDGD